MSVYYSGFARRVKRPTFELFRMSTYEIWTSSLFQLASRTVAEQTNNSKIAFTSSMSLKSPAFNRLFTTTDSFYFPLVQPMRWVLPVSNSTLLQKSFSFTIPEADRFQYLSWWSSGRLSLPSVPYRPQHSFVCVPGLSPMMTLPVVD